MTDAQRPMDNVSSMLHMYEAVYMCRARVIVAGEHAWHTWHDTVGFGTLMHKVHDVYAVRHNTTVVAMFTACITKDEAGTHRVILNGKLLRDDKDVPLVFASLGAAEAEMERACKARL